MSAGPTGSAHKSPDLRRQHTVVLAMIGLIALLAGCPLSATEVLDRCAEGREHQPDDDVALRARECSAP